MDAPNPTQNPMRKFEAPPSVSDKLAEYTTCEISDALIKLGVPHGGHIPDITMFSPSFDDTSVRICGPAYTVKMVPASDTSSPKLERHFVDSAPRGCVMVISAPPSVKSAVWGGLMTAGAQVQGVRGVVIDGRCRDIAEHRAAQFPVFARGRSTLGQGTFTHPSEINVPITIDVPTSVNPSSNTEVVKPFMEAEVNPGDIVVADVDGVVWVPPELVEVVAEKCKVSREVDAKCLEDIRAGKGIAYSFKTWRGK
ncbi:hypothetical protein BOTBODRAFT_26073 [Botryobasidium botryosum FD-172 SS1]|uniref:RraA-like protein n=1 Tax=Botryobasidium botryosum (strain FD-172 SS1) TaxID=930990 RepID=A0A067NCW4_BOTB1|nr:hypothetical protein BOTBODRAFT_26073 [Botryobasidium botryosum FD-172 SS1]